MATRCRGYRPRRLQAFQDDPQLLIIRPAPPSAGLNDLKPLNLSTGLMAVHKYCYASLNLTNKAATAGGILTKALFQGIFSQNLTRHPQESRDAGSYRRHADMTH